jgi:pimeloyl-ACP methyl ester carboxylesterase
VAYLGLGSVRYLVALYDELATSLGLRLICIDRWGLGKTGDVPDSRRGFLEWSAVVEEVLDQLEIESFSILAHSAGAPYALASSIRLDERVKGSIHLLAPWVSTAAESAAGSYKWLRYVPSSVIKTAQAAEWKVQAWKLGKPPTVALQGVGFDPRAPLSSESTASSPVFANFAKDYPDDESDPTTPRPPITFGRLSPSSSIASSLDQELAIRPSASTPSLLPVPARKPSLRTKKGSKGLFSSIFGSPRLDESTSSSIAVASGSTVSQRTSLPLKRSTSASPEPALRSKDVKEDLGTALLRASHAESLRGGTADLLTILERTNKAAGFAYSDVERPVKVWHGLKDEKISLEGVLSMERTMQNCKVTVIPGADHSLMTNVPVIVQVLRSIASDWQHL